MYAKSAGNVGHTLHTLVQDFHFLTIWRGCYIQISCVTALGFAADGVVSRDMLQLPRALQATRSLQLQTQTQHTQRSGDTNARERGGEEMHVIDQRSIQVVDQRSQPVIDQRSIQVAVCVFICAAYNMIQFRKQGLQDIQQFCLHVASPSWVYQMKSFHCFFLRFIRT